MTGYDCIILGGGASGLFAASMILKLTSGKASVLVIDGNDRCGKKLALTGSGRCNLSNKDAAVDKYHTDDPKALEKCLESFGSSDAVAFFEDTLGVEVVCDDGLYYPATYRASTVIDSFRFYLEDSGCGFKLGSKCAKIFEKSGSYEVILEDGSSYKTKHLICATGGCTYPSTGSTGAVKTLLKGIVSSDDLVGFKPALTSLNSKMAGIKALAGIRCRGMVTLTDGKAIIDLSRGEFIFSKEGGISGICVMDISGKAAAMLDTGIKPRVFVDLLGIPGTELYRKLEDRRSKFGTRTVSGALTGLMPRVLCEFVCRYAGIDPAAKMSDLGDKELKALADSVKVLEITVDGYGGADKAQVSSGGVKLSAVNGSMQYRSHKGLYIIGEALNVDGKCGGYNLQWAWSSAAAAAKGVASDV
ncbi:MAG: aminoacetone oxidase family FAD-binding enzyme [Clostridiales bacterium]|nr:aminoacetone oxidase family FAD-binding enzyme [Clostridiales bacterium]